MVSVPSSLRAPSATTVSSSGDGSCLAPGLLQIRRHPDEGRGPADAGEADHDDVGVPVDALCGLQGGNVGAHRASLEASAGSRAWAPWAGFRKDVVRGEGSGIAN